MTAYDPEMERYHLDHPEIGVNKIQCVVCAGRYDYVHIAGDWCFVTGEGFTRG